MFGLIRKPYKVYVLYKDCVQKGKTFSGILGVYNSYSEALRHFADERLHERQYWEDESIECDGQNYFYAYQDGNYCPNHCILAIVERVLDEFYNPKNNNK